ncbi:MAG TPA: YihY/virulence factor BrkB family protein [Gemmatimonadales bacterium]|nr:YihY/virulence factor BrkB family protein [Gemmatimonadales bacterium]
MNRDKGWHSSVGGTIRRTYQAAFEDNIPFLASGLSFSLLLTALPFTILLLGGIGYLVQHQITTQQVSVHELLSHFLPTGGDGRAGGFDAIERELVDIVRRRGRLTLYGIPLFLWFSTRFFDSLRVALNEVFDTDENRRWYLIKLLDVFMVCLAAVFLVASGLLSAFEARQTPTVSRVFVVHWVWSLSVEVVAFGLGIAVFYVVFKLLPSRRINWRTALVAATFCSLGFEVARRLYALYVGKFVTLDRLTSDANVAALFLFLLWIYYSAFLFLLGGEVAETYDLIRMRRAQGIRLG